MDAKQIEQEAAKAKRLEELKIRTKNCCCRYCGGELKLRRILYGNVEKGRIEIFCSDCDRIEYGVNRELYHIAKYFVDEFGFNYFPENDDSQKTYQMNVAKICDIIAWGCKNLSILDEKCFTVPIDIANTILGEDVVLYDADLDSDVPIEDMDEDAIFGRR